MNAPYDKGGIIGNGEPVKVRIEEGELCITPEGKVFRWTAVEVVNEQGESESGFRWAPIDETS